MSTSNFPDLRLPDPNQPPHLRHLTIKSSTGFSSQRFPNQNHPDPRIPHTSAFPSQHSSESSSATTNHSHGANGSPSNYLRQLIDELKDLNGTQLEVITQLKIKVAVLESELKRTGQDKESITNSLGIVIEALTRSISPQITNPPPTIRTLSTTEGNIHTGQQGSSCRHSQLDRDENARNTVKELEQEVELLRKVNKRLTRQLHDKDEGTYLRGCVRVRSTTTLQGAPHTPSRHDFGNGLLPYGEESRLRECMLDPVKFGEIMSHRTDWFQKSDGNSAKLCGDAGRAKELHSKRQNVGDGFANSNRYVQQEARVNDSFASNTTTIPNTPFLAAQKLTASTCVEDVGIHSLDEILDDEFLPHTTATLDLDDHNQKGEDKDIGKAIAEGHQQAMHKFMDIPAPGVVRTGIENQGSFRGDNYDHTLPGGNVNGMGIADGRMGYHSTRGYDLFAPHSFLHQQSSLFTESPLISPHASFEIPRNRTKDKILWNAPEERDGAIDIHMRSCSGRDMRFPQFFKHGVKFTPGETDSNFVRTVLIGNLPKDVELRDVLARVKGGEVSSAILCDTWKLTGGMSTRVVFKHEAAAEEYVDYCTTHPINFFSGDEDLPRNAEVTLIDTPTYPFTNKFNDRTRCISIPFFPSNFSLNSLEHNIACNNAYRAAALVEFWIDEHRTLHMEFASVTAASSAYAILTNWQIYRGLQIEFTLDPCAGELKELLDDPNPRLPMRARGGFGVPRLDEILPSFEKERRESGMEIPVCGEPTSRQWKQLAALANQKVDIPSFSGAEISSASWADEVNDEGELSGAPSLLNPNTITLTLPPNTSSKSGLGDESDGEKLRDNGVEEQVNAMMVDGLNEMMAQRDSTVWKDRKVPVGLAGSKYATLVPRFEDRKPSPHLCARRVSPSLGRERAIYGIEARQEYLRRLSLNNGEPKNSLEQHLSTVCEGTGSSDEVTDFLNSVDATSFEFSTDTDSDHHAPQTARNKRQVSQTAPKVNINHLASSESPFVFTRSSPLSQPSTSRMIRDIFKIQNPAIERYLKEAHVAYQPRNNGAEKMGKELEKSRGMNPDEIELDLDSGSENF